MAATFRILAALAAWTGLILQYYLAVTGRGDKSFVTVTINFFSYFTILANILCALCLTAPVLAPRSAVPRVFDRPSVRAAATLYIAITGAIYVLILHSLWSPQGLHWVADTLLHHVMPALFIVDWLVLTPKGALGWRSAIVWLAFPLIYGLWSLAHGAWAGFYPYPFIDVSRLGIARVLINMAGLAVILTFVGLVLVLVDHLMARRLRIAARPS